MQLAGKEEAESAAYCFPTTALPVQVQRDSLSRLNLQSAPLVISNWFVRQTS